MRTKAVRLYGKSDLRLEEFDLPEIKDDEILAHIISDSICMSSYKASTQGSDHKRVPSDIATNPVIIGHEFCGTLVTVGEKWKGKFREGQKFSIQPAFNYKGSLNAPGYSFCHCGGDATYVIIPSIAMEMNCLLAYEGEAFFLGSLAEPMSCIVGGYHANYHTTNGSYVHKMGIKADGNVAILAGAGPMGMGAIDYAINGDIKPKLVVVTDIDTVKLNRAASLITVDRAAARGIKLVYINTNECENAVESLIKLTDGHGFDDVFVYAPVKPVVEMGDKLLAQDGCLNFFAGPTNTEFKAEFNFYNVHYASTHIVGTSGGNTQDMIESLKLMASGQLNPSAMITHICGLDSVIETTLNLPKIPGGKKLAYTNIKLPLTAITDFREKGKSDPTFKVLADLCDKHNGLWNVEAEKFLLANAESI